MVLANLPPANLPPILTLTQTLTLTRANFLEMIFRGESVLWEVVFRSPIQINQTNTNKLKPISFSFEPTNPVEIQNNNKKVAGFDKIPTRLLNLSAEILSTFPLQQTVV